MRWPYRTAAREYREVAKVAADHGVRLALEPLNPILMNVDTFLCSIAHAVRVIESVDHPQFGLFLDVWHFWEDAGAPPLIEKQGGKILAFTSTTGATPAPSAIGIFRRGEHSPGRAFADDSQNRIRRHLHAGDFLRDKPERFAVGPIPAARLLKARKPSPKSGTKYAIEKTK